MPTAPPPPPETNRSGENPIFNLWDVLLILLVALLAQFFCLLFAMIVFQATHFRANPKDLASNVVLLLPAQVVGYILTVGFMVFLISLKYRMDFLRAVSWNMPASKTAWGTVGVGAGLAVVIQVLSAVLHPWIPKSLPIDQAIRTPSAAYALALFGILVAPFVEEMFFRGFLYPALARPLGVLPAAVLSAGGFAAIHGAQLAFAWIPLLFLFMVGMVLTLARARTKSVAVSVLMHIGYNATLFTALYIATGGFRHMERG